MTPQDLTPEDFAALGANETAYLRPVTGAEILASTPLEHIAGFDIEPDQVFYALHAADGARLAVMSDRDDAVATALAHDFALAAVH